MLNSSARECENALALTANYQLRTCAWTFMELGRFDRAKYFIELDSGSEWANNITPFLLLREGKLAEARKAVKQMSSRPQFHRDLMEACVGLRPRSELDRMAHDAVTNGFAEHDPELSYLQGSLFAYSGKKDAAFRMLTTAVALNYCANYNLIADPLLKELQSDRRFDDLLTNANECQQVVHKTDTSQDISLPIPRGLATTPEP